jgi:toxin ParE1/3/4
MNIAFALSAISDLEGIRDYYSEQGVPQVGKKFVVDIVAHIQTLSNHPDIGRVVPEFSKDYIRELNRIQIIRVWRSERLLVLDT